jgi:hypothetical protein
MLKGLIWAFVAVLIGIALGLITNYRHGFQKVYVKPVNGLQVSIYKDLGGDNAYNYNSHNTPLFKLDSPQTIRLKKGVYDFAVSDPTHKFENPITKINIGSDTNNLTIDPLFTDQELTTLLSTKRSAIQQALLNNYPSLFSFYTITSAQLYKYGNWYGAVLSPNSSQFDTLRVIMTYKNGAWRIAANPQINISIPSNPSIPSDVIDAVDQL